MQLKQPRKRSFFNHIRRIPAAGVLALGIFVGLIVAQFIFKNTPSFSAWTGGQSRSIRSQYGNNRRHTVVLPTLEQRHRVLELLTSLTPHKTRECTRHSQPIYVAQAEKRYAALVGHNPPSRSSWLRRFNTSDGSSSQSSQLKHQEITSTQHKYFFAINLYNSFEIIPDLFATLFRVVAILGYQNVFVSVYENGSTDQTKALLAIIDALSRSIGMRITIRRDERKRGTFNHRIEYLAEVRNAALVPLQELRDSEGEFFDSIIFMNDVLPCVDDILELIWQSRKQNAGVTCASDYMFNEEIGAPVFYDSWVARDINGTALENAPFEAVFHHHESSERFQRHLPIQVQSCWNGIAVLDPAPLYAPPHIRFRMANLVGEECSASECSLICNDYWNAGYGRIVMIPRVKLAYDKRVFDIIHPPRKNLTAIRGYARIGGLPDDPRSDPQDRSWYGPHDRLFLPEESEELEFKHGPEYVWCWGWDGAGEIDGPDVDPIWERMSPKSTRPDAVAIRHDRSLKP